MDRDNGPLLQNGDSLHQRIKKGVGELLRLGGEVDPDRSRAIPILGHLPQATILKSRVGLDDPPAGHPTGITIVVRNPDLQTGFLCGRDIFSDMLPGLFGVEVASRLHEQHHPADPRILHFGIGQKRSVMLAVLDEAKFRRWVGEGGVDFTPAFLPGYGLALLRRQKGISDQETSQQEKQRKFSHPSTPGVLRPFARIFAPWHAGIPGSPGTPGKRETTRPSERVQWRRL